MSQPPSNHNARSIQAPTRDGSHHRVQVHPVENNHETTSYYPIDRSDQSAPADPQYERWYQAREEPTTRSTPLADYHTPHHYRSVDAGAQGVLGEDLQHVPWREGALHTPEVFYAQDSRATPFLSPPPTSIHSPRDHQRHAATWEPEGQGRRSSEQGYHHRDAHQFNPPRESHRGDAVPVASGGTSSPMSLDREHRGPTVASRHPSLQSFGPYTTAALHPGRTPSTLSGAGDHYRSLASSHTSYSAQQQFHTNQIPHNPETPQYVVPSSRIPRADLAAHTSPADHYSTARVSHSPEEISETKPKRRRANAAQLKLLNDTYARTMFPTTEERADIARRINMTPRQVQIWFQNRRQASRQSQTLESDTPSGSTAEGIYGEGHSDYFHEPEND